MAYQILFTDLDDTLLNRQSQISAGNRRAVADAMAAGKRVVLCSGRSWHSLVPFEHTLGLDTPGCYGVAFNGFVYETTGRKVLFGRTLSPETARETALAVKSLGADAFVYAGSRLYAVCDGPELRAYTSKVNLKPTLIDDWSEIREEVIKVIVRSPHDVLAGIAREMEPLFGTRLNIVFSADNLLEFAHPEIHKGRALAFLSEYLNIPTDEMIAVGDQANDISMLQTAGLGVAVANAAAEVKAVADLVTDETNDEDAVGRLIRRYLI